ncbi:MAG: 4-amino-4-deoxy-L-arabinose transferase-like glycosyltransferase [Bradymonadia bacterium]|jgi:4-amino-4-deoxy-L-arabinose transferase-like glycosyltransferase
MLVRIALVASIVRVLVFAGALGDDAFAVLRFDELAYESFARSIWHNGWRADGQVMMLSPLWSFMWGMLLKLGFGTPIAPVVLQQVMGVASTAIAYKCARCFASMNASAVAALLLSVTGPVLFYETRALADPAVMFSFSLGLWALLSAARSPSALRWAVAGVALGVATLGRPNVLLISPLIAAAVLWSLRADWKKSVGCTVMLTLGWMLGVAPITARNYAVADEFVLVSSSGPINLYIGNGPSANGAWKRPSELNLSDQTGSLFASAWRFAEQEAGHRLTSSEQSQFWLDRTMDHVLASPGDTVLLQFTKLRMALNGHEETNNHDYRFQRRFMGVLSVPLFPNMGWLIALGVPGFLLIARRESGWVVLLTGVVLPALTFALFFVVGRYRLGWAPALVIGAAATFDALWAAKRDWRRSRLWVALVACMLVGCLWPPPHNAHRHAHFLRGEALKSNGVHDGATEMYEYAAENPVLRALALNRLAQLHHEHAMFPEAQEVYRRLADHHRAEGEEDQALAVEAMLDDLRLMEAEYMQGR